MRDSAEASLWRSLLWSILAACAGLAAGWSGRTYSQIFDEPLLRTFAVPLIGGALVGALVEGLARLLSERIIPRLFIPAVLGMIPGMMYDFNVGSLAFAIGVGTGIGLLRWFVPRTDWIFNLGTSDLKSEPVRSMES